ncbi:MAG: hypothetical protein CRN43_03305 [Candidatus Nephrothrix sp. EaCA]|nr:MAG: hypothetical protein CRN43_03305 [Candidatus Nephrothrix sp. EaCA]
MAIINTLRNKMTKVVVGFVAVAILAFVLNDLFGYGKRSLFDWNENDVGKIAGHNVSLEEFQAAERERETNYYLSAGKQPGEAEKPGLQQQAWELMTVKYAIQPQMEKLGISVSADELWDMVQGRHVEEGIKQSFKDSLGNFDRKRVIDYINMLNSPQPSNPQAAAGWQEGRYRWDMYQQNLALSRQRIKYENLLIKTSYVTAAEAEREYHTQNDTEEAQFLYVPYTSVSDSSATPSDSELRRYYDKNKARFKASFTRDMSYVTFPVIPSSADSLEVLKNAEKIAADFAAVADDSVFAVTNSDGRDVFQKYNTGNLPASLSAQLENLQPGTVLAPKLEGNSYRVTKVVKAGPGNDESAKASHILIKWTDETPEAKKTAKDKAQKILDEIRKGADFAAKARENGQDGTAGSGGDLGWFGKGQMVKPFETAVFDAAKEGLLPNLIETQFGYHIIKVTHVKSNLGYTIAAVDVNILPSDETMNVAYQKAQVFADNLSGLDAFKAKAEKEGLNVQEANALPPDSRYVGNLGEARRLVTWLFRDAKKGKTSDVIDLNDKYVVGVMTGEVKEGVKPFELVKDEVTIAVKKELKAQIIIKKLTSLTGDLSQVAASYGPDASVNSSGLLKFSATALPVAGIDADAVGRFFSLDSGKRGEPFAGENGVFIAQVTQKTPAPEVADYSQYKQQLMQSLSSKDYQIGQAIKDGSRIKDQRYRFY